MTPASLHNQSIPVPTSAQQPLSRTPAATGAAPSSPAAVSPASPRRRRSTCSSSPPCSSSAHVSGIVGVPGSERDGDAGAAAAAAGSARSPVDATLRNGGAGGGCWCSSRALSAWPAVRAGGMYRYSPSDVISVTGCPTSHLRRARLGAACAAACTGSAAGVGVGSRAAAPD
eukprot:3669685-Prymnesium_polylepis.1